MRIAALVLALPLAVTVPGAAGAQDSKLAAAIAAFAKENAFSGTVLVRDRGKTVQHRSFGIAEREFGVPVTHETRFRVASITKVFTAVLVLQLYDQGARFAEALFGGKLLKRETLGLMLTPGLDEYGYGVLINNMEIGGKSYRAVWRHGNIMGATTVLFHLPERDVTVILLSNTNATDLGAFVSRIAKVHIGG